MQIPQSQPQPQPESEGVGNDTEDFWPVLEKRICEQLSDLDRQIAELYRERDRLQYFLNDHDRKC